MKDRHPRQTSDAVGYAASQLGPRALALATQLNKGLGLPCGKTAIVLEQAFRLQGSRGGLCQALARVASKAEPTYHALVEQIRSSPSVTPEETGWRVDGKLWWMWAFSTSGGKGLQHLARTRIGTSRSGERTLQVSWCGMDGASIVSLSTPCTKPVCPTCCGAAEK